MADFMSCGQAQAGLRERARHALSLHDLLAALLHLGAQNVDVSAIETYRDLKVWQAGIQLAKSCYVLTKTFPKEETFGLTSQIRHSAASIPANIAEGHGRDNTGDYIRCLCIAQGSLKELETLLILACEVRIGDERQIDSLLHNADEIGRMLRALIRALQAHQKN